MDQQLNQEGQAATEEGHHDCGIRQIPFTVEPALPEVIMDNIENCLHLASHYLTDGEELPSPVFVVISAEGKTHLLNGMGADSIRAMEMWVASIAHREDAVAIISMTEAFTVPSDDAKKLIEDGVPEGFNIKEHPNAFESILIKVETLNGNWTGQMKIKPFVETKEGEAKAERFDDASMALHKDAIIGGFVGDMLIKNRLKLLPEGLRQAIEHGLNETMQLMKEEEEASAKADEESDSTVKPTLH